MYADGSSGGVIGANAMMYHDVVFDLAHNRVGFARSTCAGAPDAPGLGGPGGFDTANTPGNYSKFIGAFERLCLVPWGAFCSVALVRAHVCAVCVGCGRGCGHDWCCLGHRCLRGAHRLRGSKRLPRRPGSGESYTPTTHLTCTAFSPQSRAMHASVFVLPCFYAGASQAWSPFHASGPTVWVRRCLCSCVTGSVLGAHWWPVCWIPQH